MTIAGIVLTAEDLADLDQLLDEFPHGFSKRIAAFINDRIVRQQRWEAEAAERAEASQPPPNPPPPSESAFTDFADWFAEQCALPPPDPTIH